MRLVELRSGEPVPELLRRLRGEGMSTTAIARNIEVPHGTVRRWLVWFGLDDATLIRRGLQVPSRELLDAGGEALA